VGVGLIACTFGPINNAGEVAERLKAPLSKSGSPARRRGFESHPLRQTTPRLRLAGSDRNSQWDENLSATAGLGSATRRGGGGSEATEPIPPSPPDYSEASSGKSENPAKQNLSDLREPVNL
jgi:hypothetical protein